MDLSKFEPGLLLCIESLKGTVTKGKIYKRIPKQQYGLFASSEFVHFEKDDNGIPNGAFPKFFIFITNLTELEKVLYGI